MKFHVTHLITFCLFSAPFLLNMPVVYADYATPDAWDAQEDILRNESKLNSAPSVLSIRGRLQAKEYDIALKEAQRLSDLQPASPDPLTLMGMAYAGKGEQEKARAAFAEALKMDPGNPNAGISLALIAAEAGDFDAARAYYQQILKAHPDNLVALLQLAQLEAAQGNKQAALTHIQEAVQDNPKAMEPLVALARLQMKTGDVQQALATLDRVPRQYAGQPLFLEALGEVQLTAGDQVNALSTLQKWLKLQPASARAHYLVGAAYLANKDRSAAKAALFKGLELNPDLLAASELMTLMVSTEPHLKEKDKLVRELKKVQPEHPQVMDLDAQLALRHGDADQAVRIYQDLQQRYPDTVVWVKALARAQWKAEKQEDFLATLNAWVKKHPDDANVHFMLASAYMQLGREDEAKAALILVIKQSPNYAPALNNLAWLLRDDDPKQALAYAQRAYQLSPKNPAVLDTLGMVLLQQGDKAKALELLEQAATLSPENATLAYHYAMALAENGQQEQARDTLSGVRNKTFPEQEQAQALYESLY